MNVRALPFLLTLIPALASAQVDEWSTFPGSTTPAPPVAEPAKPPPPASAEVKPAAAKKEKKPEPSMPAAPIVTAPPTDGELAQIKEAEAPAETADEVQVVSHQERVLPGTEHHSPATWGRSFDDPANRRIVPGIWGASGLNRTSSAVIGPKGLLRFGVMGEYLNQPHFPVRGAHDVRTAGTFAVSYAPLKWLETFLSYGAGANSNTYSAPTLIQSLGDVSFGAKASREWLPGLYAGLDLRLLSFSGVGNQSVDRIALGFASRLLGSWDVRTISPKVPLLVHLNAGMFLDGTGGLVRSHQLNAPEEFALGVNRYHRFATGVGVEVPLPVVTPYVEYNLAVPLGVRSGLLESPDGSTIPVSAAMPQTIGAGLKVTAIKDLTLSLGADFGLTRSVGLGVPATAPWNLFFGAAFNVDPFQRGETKIVETVRERKVEEKIAVEPSRIEGVVVDAQTKKPLPGVVVAMVGASVPPVASESETGRFLTHGVPDGTPMVKLAVFKDGYEETTQEVALQPGQNAKVEVELQPKEKLAHFLVTVLDIQKKPVVAKVSFKGPKESQLDTPGKGAEPSRLDVPPGRYLVNVVAEKHLAQTREVQVSEGAEMKLAFELEPEPKKILVVVKQDKIEILQQVHFATNAARILPNSYGLLNQVVDAIVKHDVKRVRVEGHTDNRGPDQKNLELSDARAKAVAEYLIKQGIDPSRIEAVGFGETKPIAPNLTARGRELNRRVDFFILEK